MRAGAERVAEGSESVLAACEGSRGPCSWLQAQGRPTWWRLRRAASRARCRCANSHMPTPASTMGTHSHWPMLMRLGQQTQNCRAAGNIPP